MYGNMGLRMQVVWILRQGKMDKRRAMCSMARQGWISRANCNGSEGKERIKDGRMMKRQIALHGSGFANREVRKWRARARFQCHGVECIKGGMTV